MNEAGFNDEIRSGLVVCIYSDVKKGRPWCGRILRVDEGRKFLLQWYSKKKGSSNTFVASLNSDGSPYTSLLDTETVMLWNFSSDIDNTSFHINNYFVTKIKELYITNDSEFQNRSSDSQTFKKNCSDLLSVDTNIDAVETAISSIKRDGLVLKESFVNHTDKGILFVQTMFTIEDEKVAVEDLSKIITASSNHIQSVNVAAVTMQKSYMVSKFRLENSNLVFPLVSYFYAMVQFNIII